MIHTLLALCMDSDWCSCLWGVQTVLDALRARKDRFIFEGNDIALRNSVMAFITMNPGYPGRAELPESLKVHHGCASSRCCEAPGCILEHALQMAIGPMTCSHGSCRA